MSERGWTMSEVLAAGGLVGLLAAAKVGRSRSEERDEALDRTDWVTGDTGRLHESNAQALRHDGLACAIVNVECRHQYALGRCGAEINLYRDGLWLGVLNMPQHDRAAVILRGLGC